MRRRSQWFYKMVQKKSFLDDARACKTCKGTCALYDFVNANAFTEPRLWLPKKYVPQRTITKYRRV